MLSLGHAMVQGLGPRRLPQVSVAEGLLDLQIDPGVVIEVAWLQSAHPNQKRNRSPFKDSHLNGLSVVLLNGIQVSGKQNKTSSSCLYYFKSRLQPQGLHVYE